MKHLMVPLLAFLLWALPASAFDRFDIVTTEQVREMLAAREAGTGEDFLLVNTLDDIIYHHEHIPGSVSLPWTRVADYEPVLGGDKAKSLVFY